MMAGIRSGLEHVVNTPTKSDPHKKLQHQLIPADNAYQSETN